MPRFPIQSQVFHSQSTVPPTSIISLRSQKFIRQTAGPISKPNLLISGLGAHLFGSIGTYGRTSLGTWDFPRGVNTFPGDSTYEHTTRWTTTSFQKVNLPGKTRPPHHFGHIVRRLQESRRLCSPLNGVTPEAKPCVTYRVADSVPPHVIFPRRVFEI